MVKYTGNRDYLNRKIKALMRNSKQYVFTERRRRVQAVKVCVAELAFELLAEIKIGSDVILALKGLKSTYF